MPPRLVVPRRLRTWVLSIARARILAANVEFDQADPGDDIAMLDCQERTDAVMKALFRR